MADSPSFQFASDALTKRTDFEAIEARGTIRIALGEAGLSAKTVTPEQMVVVIERVLPRALEKRGIENASELCQELSRGVKRIAPDASAAESPESIFERLAEGESC